mmetsp:Transcript_6415/g.24097  ORF Transcript_6415/g.24097 Transcript_6415/m.24097 type:complete len:735 (-) Transcript_6415:72-2276(-)
MVFRRSRNKKIVELQPQESIEMDSLMSQQHRCVAGNTLTVKKIDSRSLAENRHGTSGVPHVPHLTSPSPVTSTCPLSPLSSHLSLSKNSSPDSPYVSSIDSAPPREIQSSNSPYSSQGASLQQKAPENISATLLAASGAASSLSSPTTMPIHPVNDESPLLGTTKGGLSDTASLLCTSDGIPSHMTVMECTPQFSSPQVNDMKEDAPRGVAPSASVVENPWYHRVPSPRRMASQSFFPLLALTAFSLLTFSNALNWLTYAPVSQLTISTYHLTSDMQLNMLSLIYMFIYPFGAPIANVICVLTSAGVGLLLGASLNLIGSFIRYFSVFFVGHHFENGGINTAYTMLMVGQTLCSISQCFIIGVPPLIANRYFPPKLRPLVTAIGVLMNCSGIGMAFLLSPVARRIGLDEYQLIWAVLAGVAMIFIVVFFILSTDWLFVLKLYRNRRRGRHIPEAIPRQESIDSSLVHIQEAPPVATLDGTYYQKQVDASAVGETNPTVNSVVRPGATTPLPRREFIWRMVNKLLDVVRPFINIHFVLLTFCFGVAMGSVWAIATMIDQILGPLGYSSDDTAILGVTNVMCGVLGIFVSGFLGSLLGHLRSLLKIFYILSALSMVYFAFCLKPGMRVWLILSQVCLGFSTSAVIPISLELGAEVIYSIDEAIGANHQMVAGNAVAICLIFLMTFLNSNGRGVLSVWILAGLCVVACLVSFIYFGKYKRRNHEKKLIQETSIGQSI